MNNHCFDAFVTEACRRSFLRAGLSRPFILSVDGAAAAHDGRVSAIVAELRRRAGVPTRVVYAALRRRPSNKQDHGAGVLNGESC
jgi:hypothetical protein